MDGFVHIVNSSPMVWGWGMGAACVGAWGLHTIVEEGDVRNGDMNTRVLLMNIYIKHTSHMCTCVRYTVYACVYVCVYICLHVSHVVCACMVMCVYYLDRGIGVHLLAKCLSVHYPMTCPRICARICPRICARICPRICPRIYPRICPRICPMICPRICHRIFPRVCPRVYPSVCPRICSVVFLKM